LSEIKKVIQDTKNRTGPVLKCPKQTPIIVRGAAVPMPDGSFLNNRFIPKLEEKRNGN
jgi:hypothetical protein